MDFPSRDQPGTVQSKGAETTECRFRPARSTTKIQNVRPPPIIVRSAEQTALDAVDVLSCWGKGKVET